MLEALQVTGCNMTVIMSSYIAGEPSTNSAHFNTKIRNIHKFATVHKNNFII